MVSSNDSKELKVFDGGRIVKKSPSEYIKSRFGSKRMNKIDEIEKELTDHFVSLIGGDSTLLDIPCGSGRFLNRFRGLRRVIAMDINKGMVDEAEMRNPFDNIEFMLSGVQKIPLENNAVDAVFCMRLLHHIENKNEIKAIMAEIARVSRKFVLISFYRKGGLRYWLKKIRGKKISGKPIDCDEMIKLCESVGLSFFEIHKLPATTQTILLLLKNGK
jgi:2-polyprenyl-3-methyl-5-hydroxy-6-metoxy-1,4-benzoquinol methylase